MKHSGQTLKPENIISVECAKGFHLYKRRNEWINWDGDTSLVRRSFKEVKTSLHEAKACAERLRKPGTKFFIDELPIVVVRGERTCLIISELFTDSPLSHYIENAPRLKKGSSLWQLQDAIISRKWTVCINDSSNADFCPSDGSFFSRKSSPGGAGNSLAWSLTERKINTQGIRSLVNSIIEIKSETAAFPVRVGTSRMDIIERLGKPAHTQQVKFSDLSNIEAEQFQNMHLPGDLSLETWIYIRGSQKLTLYLLPDTTNFHMGDPGVVAIYIK